MKTDLFKTIKSGTFYLMLGIAMTAGFASCITEEVTEDNVVGLYTNLTDNSNTEITIQQASGNFTLRCIFDDNREGSYKSYTWTGTFSNIPEDDVMSGNEKIGRIKFSSKSVTFEAYTQREGTYKGYRDDLADIGYSRSTSSDSIVVKTDSIQ